MARYIDAKQIRYCWMYDSDGTEHDGVTLESIVDKVPTADVAEVKHGEWLLRHVGHGHYWECSICHTNPCIYVTKDTKYCPNCGAKMDGKGD